MLKYFAFVIILIFHATAFAEIQSAGRKSINVFEVFYNRNSNLSER